MSSKLKAIIVRWLFGDSIERLAGAVGEARKMAADAARDAGEATRRARAIAALDIGMRHDDGFVVIAARVNGETRVRFWAVPPMCMRDWQLLDRQLREQYGFQNEHTDLPRGYLADMWREI